ncbi:MAG: outer membrane beta-barrel protein [Proteobacteria bacterium]|nr:outer membrane beta-barrel protein [Pseudomonadota bacterium]
MKLNSKLALLFTILFLGHKSANAQTAKDCCQQAIINSESSSKETKSPDKEIKTSDKEVKTPKANKFRSKTQGHYLGISVNANQMTYHEEVDRDEFSQVLGKVKPSTTGYGFGGGLSYKYAINFNNFFIAPSLFAERFNNHVNASSEIWQNKLNDQKTSLSAKYRYGATTDFGYDFNKYFSSYVTGGYGITSFRAENGISTSYRFQSSSKNPRDISAIFGGGFIFRISESVSLNIEANTQRFRVKADANVPLNTFNYKAHFSGRLNVVKLGLSYNF